VLVVYLGPEVEINSDTYLTDASSSAEQTGDGQIAEQLLRITLASDGMSTRMEVGHTD
jgi:hypothetical protein